MSPERKFLSWLLSPRQTALARAIGRGLTDKEIAAELGITPGTTKIYVHRALVLLRLETRTQLALWVHGHF